MEDVDGGEFGQVKNDYIGEESIWDDNFEFSLGPVYVELKWLLIAKEHILRILTNLQIKILRDIYFKKRQLREEMLNRYRANCELLKKFKQRRQTQNPER